MNCDLIRLLKYISKYELAFTYLKQGLLACGCIVWNTHLLTNQICKEGIIRCIVLTSTLLYHCLNYYEAQMQFRAKSWIKPIVKNYLLIVTLCVISHFTRYCLVSKFLLQISMWKQAELLNLTRCSNSKRSRCWEMVWK